MGDGELLLAWRDGDRAAGEELFERHYPTVERFFRNKVSEPDELIQRTFLACTESAARFRGDSKFRTFLLGIAFNVLRTFYRQLQRDRGLDSIHESSVADLGQTPSRVVCAREEEELLLAALRLLPCELQVLIELRYWENLKHDELAEILEHPRSTINSKLRRARKLLDEGMRTLARTPQVFDSTVGNLQEWVEQQRRRGPLGPGSTQES
ncbi:MAG: RNA polymerase sigma factor [Myxococcota bacterium]